jgi:hypothetical protein
MRQALSTVGVDHDVDNSPQTGAKSRFYNGRITLQRCYQVPKAVISASLLPLLGVP